MQKTTTGTSLLSPPRCRMRVALAITFDGRAAETDQNQVRALPAGSVNGVVLVSRRARRGSRPP